MNTTNKTSKYIEQAIDLSSKGYFLSKSSQKQAIDNLNRAYDNLTDYSNIKFPKGSTPQQKWEFRFDLPQNLHHVNEKHRPIFDKCGLDVEYIMQVSEIRSLVKSMDIIKPSKDNAEQKLNDIIIKMAKEHPKKEGVISLKTYNFAEDEVDLLEKSFGSIKGRVNYDWHHVTNQYGTSFIRVFWYLDMKVTKLSTILSLASKEKKGAN
tara:strand:+ start:169 stop:792 length:624 start_codon:yes stop_codon:yes gene_type:complete